MFAGVSSYTNQLNRYDRHLSVAFDTRMSTAVPPQKKEPLPFLQQYGLESASRTFYFSRSDPDCVSLVCILLELPGATSYPGTRTMQAADVGLFKSGVLTPQPRSVSYSVWN